MADDQRSASNAVTVIEALHAEPHAYDFFQAMRLLERAFDTAPRWGEAQRPCDEPVRLGQDPSMAFAPSTISSFKAREQGAPRMGVLFFGVFGPNGALPLHLTEHAQQRQHHQNDPTLARFIDLFHHRMLSLVFRVWASSRPAVQRDRPSRDRFAAYVLSLCGRGSPALRDRDEMPDLAKLYYSGRLAAQARNAEGLSAIVSDYFQISARVEQFVGEWVDIPKEYCWSVGGKSRRGAPRMGVLGRTTMLGSRVYSVQHKFRIALGPLTRGRFHTLSPGGSAVPELISIVRNYVGDEFAWDVRLIPRPEAINAMQLGSGLLGWTTWLGRDHGPTPDYEDLIFDPIASEAAQARAAQASQPPPMDVRYD